MSKKAIAFNLVMVASAIAEAIVGLSGAQAHKDALNSALRQAKQEGVKWGSNSPKHEGSLAYEIGKAIAARGCSPDTVKVTLATVKWAFENGVEVSTLTLSRLKLAADKGAANDLLTGKPKKVQAGKGKAGNKKAKVEAKVNHCGYGLLQAIEAEGFVKWATHLFDRAEIMGVDSTSDHEEILSLFRGSLIDCGFATVNDKDETVVKEIAVSDNEEEA